MRLRVIIGIVLTLFLIGFLTLAFNVQPVKASGTIYIRADGSIDPPAANITSVDNVTYYFTDNNYDEIVVERDNIVVDGAGYTLQGPGSGTGINLTERSNVTIKNMTVKGFFEGIVLSSYSSNNNSIVGNNITTNNGIGIHLSGSSNNSISGNNITNNYAGIIFLDSSNNSIYGNNITNNELGIDLFGSSNNSIYGNNITTNKMESIYLYRSSNNSIFRNTVTANDGGVYLGFSSNNTISGNNITANNEYGILLSDFSHNNAISGNNITNNNGTGIKAFFSSGNTISGNNITNNNEYGIWLGYSYNNRLFHNNFVDNTQQVRIETSRYPNIWDDGYPSGGNYWSDYVDVDQYSGPGQNETGSDGIWDNPYIFDGNNTDRYPLTTEIPEFPTWTSMLLILMVLTFAIAIYKRKLLKTPIQ